MLPNRGRTLSPQKWLLPQPLDIRSPMSTNANFNIFLKEELNRRKRNNPGYSLRAFSKQLGLSSSFVSKVMKGQKNISEETLLKISSRLNLSSNELGLFIDTDEASNTEAQFTALAVDQFQYISDWYHYAILEAATLKNFKATPDWISNHLNLPLEVADAALKRLQRLNLIKISKDLKLESDIQNNTSVGQAVPTSAHTEHERQLLHKAIEALDLYSTDVRSQSSMTLAIPASRLGEAKDKIKKFRREMSELLQRKGERDSVYQLSISFFPLIQTTNKKTLKGEK